MVEIDASRSGDMVPQRIRLHFRGFVQARVNDPADVCKHAQRVLQELHDGRWIDDFARSYLEAHGPKLSEAAIKGVKHFIVSGHDMTIGLLARRVELSPCDCDS
jgi:hypothetical protein